MDKRTSTNGNKVLGYIAKRIAVRDANTTCPFLGYQPKLPTAVREIRELLLKMKEENKLIILASHNREDIEVLCDEVYEMEGGVISKVKDETN